MVLVKAADFVKGEVWMETAVPFREIWGVVVCFMPTCSPLDSRQTLAVPKQDLCSATGGLISILVHIFLVLTLCIPLL